MVLNVQFSETAPVISNKFSLDSTKLLVILPAVLCGGSSPLVKSTDEQVLKHFDNL